MREGKLEALREAYLKRSVRPRFARAASGPVRAYRAPQSRHITVYFPISFECGKRAQSCSR